MSSNENNEEQQISQIDYSDAFVQALIDKLKVGNRRGIHLNALPGRYASRLDLHALSILPESVHKAFLDTLLSKDEFSFKINFEGIDLTKADEKEKQTLNLLARRLDNLAYEAENQLLEFGIDNFGFGYPLLIRRDTSNPEKVVKAPLFIWLMQIEKSNRKSNEWTLTKTEDSPIILNELLRSHILHDAQVTLDAIEDGVLEDGVVDTSEISQIISDILNQLNTGEEVNLSETDIKVEKCPQYTRDVDALATDNAWIQWSGVFGIYRARKEPIIKRGEELLSNIAQFQDEPLVLEKFRTSTISSVETDPSKEELVNTLTSTEVKTIQGPPGTGKSQALTAIITNVLQNGGKCLVVCEKKTALDIIYKNLSDIGLQELCAVIDDVNRDRAKVVRSARDRINTSAPYVNEEGFKRKYKEYKGLRDKINERHRDILSPVFGEASWKDAIGNYLRFARGNNLSGIIESLKKYRLQFSPDEFESIKGKVLEAEGLYGLLGTESGLLSQSLEKKLFEEKYTVGTRDAVLSHGEKLVESILTLNSEVSKYKTKDIKDAGTTIFTYKKLEKVIEEIEGLVTVCADAVSLSKDLDGEELKNEKLNKLGTGIEFRALSLVQSQLRAWIRKKQEYRNAIGKVNDVIRQTEMIKEDVLPDVSEIELEESFKDLNRLLRVKKKELSKFKQITGIRSRIEKLEKKVSKQTERYFTVAIKFKIGSYKNWDKYVKEIDSLKEWAEKIDTALVGYEHVHKWEYFMVSLGKQEKKLMRTLMNHEDAEDWEEVFSAWYFYRLLLSTESERKGALSSAELSRLSELSGELKEEQPRLIKSVWSQKAHRQRRKYEQESGAFNLLYNLRRNSVVNRTNPLRKIIARDFELFTSVFPVLLVNPIVVDSILPLEQGLFEVVLFDEASQLRIEDTFTSLVRGRYKIVSGDKHQMPPSSYFQAEADLPSLDSDGEDDRVSDEESAHELALSESLLDYANNLPLGDFRSESYLDYHYRSKHPSLIEFSNQAFYGGNLVPFPATEEYTPIHLEQVSGVWTDGVNEEEAQYVLSVLRSITPNDDGVFPSVGIATFNITQRNRIIDLINETSFVDADFRKKVDGLRESDLFVKNLENIQGDERDIIILSTTYGPGADGRFLQRFGPINYEKGYRLLNVIITRAKYKIFVCTSIPAERYSNYAEHLNESGNNRKAVLYAYLAYAKAISDKDVEKAQTVLEDLHNNTLDTPRVNEMPGLVESPFEQEVYELLRENFSEDEVKPQYKIGGFRIDFVIDVPGKKKVAIECDGKMYHSSNEAYAYDSYREGELRRMGFDVYRIWSSHWWNDHENELQKLLSYVASVHANTENDINLFT